MTKCRGMWILNLTFKRGAPHLNVKHLDHLNLTVRNFEETSDWYKRVFEFEIMERGLYRNNAWGVLKAGDAILCIYQEPEREFWTSEQLGSKRVHGINHFALRITDRRSWEKVIERENIKVDYGGAYQWPHSTSWYINDPTGYSIEVVLWSNNEVTF